MASSSIERIRQRRMAIRFSVFALMMLCLIVFLASRGNETEDGSPLGVLEDGVSPILAYLSMPVRGVENILSEIQARNHVHEENERLRKELERLKDAEIRANALALKITKFETLLNVDTGAGIPKNKIAARAVSERDGPFVRSALINAGRNKGISKGFAVMTSEGLYGHVVRVGENSSRALKLTDLNSRVAVMSLRSEGRAILTGDNTDFPSLSYVSNSDDWKVGDDVVTSGDDGVLPRGLPVGKVRMEKSRALKVDLDVDGTRVDWVLIVPFDQIESLPEFLDEADENNNVLETSEQDISGANSPAYTGAGGAPVREDDTDVADVQP